MVMQLEVSFARSPDCPIEAAGSVRLDDEGYLAVLEKSGPHTDYIQRVADDVNRLAQLAVPVPDDAGRSALFPVSRGDPDFVRALRHKLALSYGLILDLPDLDQVA